MVNQPDFEYTIKESELQRYENYCTISLKTQSDTIRHRIKQTEQQIREKVMDEFGILYGEDAKRFREQMENPEPMDERGKETVKRAYEIIAKEKKEKENIIRNKTLNNLKALFELFEDKKSFRYSANDIIEYINNFQKLESLRENE